MDLSKYICNIYRVITLGIVNLDAENNQLVLKDPITSCCDIVKEKVDNLRKMSKGVWIGARPIKDIASFGISSAALRIFNIDIMHQAVMIDGRVFSLENDKEESIKIKEIVSDSEKNRYEWRYRGKTKFNLDKIIETVNNLQISYNLIFANCQDVSDALSKYALGIYSIDNCVNFIFPNKANEGKILASLKGDILIAFLY